MSSLDDHVRLVKEQLNVRRWDFALHEISDRSVLMIGSCKSRSRFWNQFNFCIDVQESQIANTIYLPVSAKECIPQMAEFAAYLNGCVDYGAFMLDIDEGDVSFRIALPMAALRADDKLFSTLLDDAVDVIDLYEKEFSTILLGEMTAKEISEANQSQL